MIKDAISKLIIVDQESSDGGLESVLSIIKYYKTNAAMVNFNYLISELYDRHNTFECLRLAASRYGLIAVICDNIDIKTVIEYNQPIIINVSNSENQNNFLVCFGFDEQNEFKIYDAKKGNYNLSVIGIQSIWSSSTCLAFVNS